MPFQMTFLDAWILDLEKDYTQNIKLFSREVVLPDILKLTERTEKEDPAKKCFKCNASKREDGSKLLKCRGCLVARYCGETCQSEDWSRHRGYCLVLQEQMEIRAAEVD